MPIVWYPTTSRFSGVCQRNSDSWNPLTKEAESPCSNSDAKKYLLTSSAGIRRESESMASHQYDVAVIGGGPAGSTAAAFLAQGGARVAVFEREKFPRFHIGESLLPFNMSIFRKLGITRQLKEKFLEKRGAEFLSADGQVHQVYRFEDGFIPGEPFCYEVLRSEFDQLLLKVARERGAEVFQGQAVTEAIP